MDSLRIDPRAGVRDQVPICFVAVASMTLFCAIGGKLPANMRGAQSADCMTVMSFLLRMPLDTRAVENGWDTHEGARPTGPAIEVVGNELQGLSDGLR